MRLFPGKRCPTLLRNDATPSAYSGVFVYLDAAQLVKHAFGLSTQLADHEVVLFYVFWEPENRTAIENSIRTVRSYANLKPR